MDLYEVIDQVAVLLQKRGRLAYRALKLQFQLADEQLAALKDELIHTQKVGIDEDGITLVWVGAAPVPSSTFQVQHSQPPVPNTQHPISYTPPHLAECILAEQAA